jgi:hypothetical protein
MNPIADLELALLPSSELYRVRTTQEVFGMADPLARSAAGQ